MFGLAKTRGALPVVEDLRSGLTSLALFSFYGRAPRARPRPPPKPLPAPTQREVHAANLVSASSEVDAVCRGHDCCVTRRHIQQREDKLSLRFMQKPTVRARFQEKCGCENCAPLYQQGVCDIPVHNKLRNSTDEWLAGNDTTTKKTNLFWVVKV